ncbi:MAG: tRNA-dihydrouridine synthase A, partial [Oleispira sp.]
MRMPRQYEIILILYIYSKKLIMTQADKILKTSATHARDSLNRRFTTAPMMEWSDSHCRQFWRHLTRDAVMYTEMVTTGA